jgi:hypothetical protein
MRSDEEVAMVATVAELSVEQLQAVIRDTVEQVLEDRLEDLQALSSKAYLSSIKEARDDYQAGRVTPIEDLING